MSYIFPLIIYYLAWFLGIIFAARQAPWLAGLTLTVFILMQLIYQIKISKKTKGLVFVICMFTLLGFFVDTLLLRFGLIHFAANPFTTIAPVWMILLWTNFSLVFYAFLDNFFKRYLLLAALSLILFPLAYALGSKMGAANLPYGYLSTMILGVIWAFFLPFFLFIYEILYNKGS